MERELESDGGLGSVDGRRLTARLDSSSPVSGCGSLSLQAPVCLTTQHPSGAKLVQGELWQVCVRKCEQNAWMSVCVHECKIAEKCVSLSGKPAPLEAAAFQAVGTNFTG